MVLPYVRFIYIFIYLNMVDLIQRWDHSKMQNWPFLDKIRLFLNTPNTLGLNVHTIQTVILFELTTETSVTGFVVHSIEYFQYQLLNFKMRVFIIFL